ncbi:hypothetical protein ABES38_07985 [Bacillus gobiensis]|uniref:hypothetical protein n=1 Tax=Bacillus gobiensis TaxID=1441095 RepID=UPI003D1D7CC4
MPLIFKLNRSETKSWFLPLHMSETYQRPAIIAMIVIGVIMLGVGVSILWKHQKLQQEKDSF